MRSGVSISSYYPCFFALFRGTRTYLISLSVGQHRRERARERATHPERAVEAASEGACWGVRGAKPLGEISGRCLLSFAPGLTGSPRTPAARAASRCRDAAGTTATAHR